MPVLQTQISTREAPIRAKRRGHCRVRRDLRERVRATAPRGRPESARQNIWHAANLRHRERVKARVDSGSTFVELRSGGLRMYGGSAENTCRGAGRFVIYPAAAGEPASSGMIVANWTRRGNGVLITRTVRRISRATVSCRREPDCRESTWSIRVCRHAHAEGCLFPDKGNLVALLQPPPKSNCRRARIPRRSRPVMGSVRGGAYVPGDVRTITIIVRIRDDTFSAGPPLVKAATVMAQRPHTSGRRLDIAYFGGRRSTREKRCAGTGIARPSSATSLAQGGQRCLSEPSLDAVRGESVRSEYRPY